VKIDLAKMMKQKETAVDGQLRIPFVQLRGKFHGREQAAGTRQMLQRKTESAATRVEQGGETQNSAKLGFRVQGLQFTVLGS
jgi:hypothetical protein